MRSRSRRVIESPVPLSETHLPVWCTHVRNLAEERLQNQLRLFFSWKDAEIAILKLERDVSPSLLEKCGGAHMVDHVEKEGQVNTSFKTRHFVLWPRRRCELVARGFRVLYYFDSPTATKAKGRVLIDNPVRAIAFSL